MEWVETTAKTLEEAKELALDQLGIDDDDAEFEVVEEPRPGLFGRMRGEARVRARVRPVLARPKVERRDRRKGRDGRGREGRSHKKDDRPGGRQEASPGDDTAPDSAVDTADNTVAETPTAADEDRGPDRARTSEPVARAGRKAARAPRGRDRTGASRTAHEEEGSEEPVTELELAAQGEVVRNFLGDLLDAFDVDGEVTLTNPDDQTIEAAVTGSDLGLLIGPKGQTLQAVQELCRSVVQRQRPGENHARLRVDVAGYRERRREALERFARDVAQQVRDSGQPRALEAMPPPDRKIVHDALNDVEGVVTSSEGEEPRRRVVVSPA
ncbi:MAG: RNA-binding cell elongation regulator Jag/EloR [Acidimicrobiia bacterium]